MCLQKSKIYCVISYLVFTLVGVIESAYNRPNIVFILADDLGFNDLSFHGSDQIPTPNIDALAYNGLILNNHYVQPMCTPSRAALMTGRYPIHTGMQGMPTFAAEPNGLPLNLRILPQYLKDLGYVTRCIGKWHLGFFRREYLPQSRGCDSHFGIWAGFTSYYDYILQDVYNGVEFSGYDLHRNMTTAWEYSGRYATDLFTDEAVDIIARHPIEQPLFLYMAHLAVHAGNRGKYLEAPQEEINKFLHIPDPNRRTYAAMVSKLDESVGRVVEALQRRNMLDNTIIVFTSDNGAPSTDNAMPSIRTFPNWGSNYPFRGAKETLWEGGVRSPTILWSLQFQNSPRVATQLMHMTDWLPTLYTAAGGDVSLLPYDLDGVDQWYILRWNLPSRRDQVLLNINERDRNAALIQVYDKGSVFKQTWKVVFGNFKNNEMDGFYGDTRSVSNPIYNVTAVITSRAYRALSTLYASPALIQLMYALRRQATITCPGIVTNTTVRCDVRPCLFNLDRDPCERVDVALNNSVITHKLYQELVSLRATLVPQTNQPVNTFQADPRKWNNTWTVWSI